MKIIRSDNINEFKNAAKEDFCKEKGLVERENKTFIEVARTMLDEALSTHFLVEAL